MSKRYLINPNRKEVSGYSTAFELQGGQQAKQNQDSANPILQQQPNALPTANYNLPGVISYLTSEFTHLERFKITTNLEKSEMKYKILQLTSEVNSLRFINDKQAIRIRELEEQLQLNGLQTSSQVPDVKIPQVDLEILQRSRSQLNKLIRDVVRVLKPPLAISKNYLNAPNTLHGTDFDELLDDSERFLFENEAQDEKARESIFARYMNDANGDELLLSNFEEDAQRLADLVQSDLAEQNAANTSISRKPPPQDDNETDTETVIVDEAEDVLAKPKLSVRFGQETRLLAKNCSLFEPFQNLIVFLEDSQVTVLELGEPILKTSIDLSNGTILGIYYLGKKRLLVISVKGVSVLTCKDSGSSSTKVLLKDEKSVMETCSLVEVPTVNANKHYALAVSGMGKDGKLIISVHEIKSGNKTTLRLLGQFNSTFLKASEKVKNVDWADKPAEEDASDDLPFDLIILHEKIQRLDITKKKLTDIKDEGDYHSTSVHNNLLLTVLQDSVELYDLRTERTVGVLPRHKHANYVLFKSDNTSIAEILDQLVLFDKEMQEMVRHASPIHSPKTVYGLESEHGIALIIQGSDSISIIPLGLD